MAELPYMQLYPGDYLMDTRHLTLEEHGAYLLLLMEYWTNGCALRDDDKRFARTLGVPLKRWKAMRPVIEEFFVTDGVTWAHKRIEVDLAKVRAKVGMARKAGKASGRARTLNTRSTDVQHETNERSTDVERKGQRKGNGKATIPEPEYNPLTPLRSADEDAPGPSGGRASASDVAKPIGEIVANLPRSIPA